MDQKCRRSEVIRNLGEICEVELKKYLSKSGRSYYVTGRHDVNIRFPKTTSTIPLVTRN